MVAIEPSEALRNIQYLNSSSIVVMNKPEGHSGYRFYG